MNVSLPLGTLFRAPTLERMARELDISLVGRTERPSALSCIQPKGREAPLVCLHGGDGGTIFYRNLLPFAGEDRAIFTIESPALVDASLPVECESIQLAARKYIGYLREARPHGPYVLAGYSYGGILAFEMARILEAEGESVPLVVLFDTEHPNYKPRLLSSGERLAAIWRQAGDCSLPERIGYFLKRMTMKLRSKQAVMDREAEARRLQEQGIQAADEGLRHFQHNAAAVKALENYETAAWQGRVLLLRCEHNLDDKYDRSNDYGWTPLVRELIVERIPGNHLDIWDDPHVEKVGTILRRQLDRLATRPASGTASVSVVR